MVIFITVNSDLMFALIHIISPMKSKRQELFKALIYI